MPTHLLPSGDPDHRWPAWFGPVAATLAIHAAALTAYVLVYHGEISALLCADRKAIGEWPYEAVRVGFGASGFDGQLYFVLARDPWRAHGDPIDWPAYRHSRILYPALAWLMTGGDPVALLWAMPALNLAALAGICWLGALIAGHYGRNPWWGFALIFALNAGTPAYRNLTDPMATLAACGLITAWLLGWRAWATGAWAVAAVLSREQNIVLVLLVLLEAVIQQRWRVAFALAAAGTVWLAWVGTLRWVYGVWPFLSVNNSWPLTGIHFRLTHMTGARATSSSPIHLLGMGLLFLHMAMSGLLVLLRAPRMVTLISLAGAGLAVVAGVPIFDNLESYTRVFWWMPFGVWLWSIQAGRGWPVVLLAATAAIFPALALLQAWNTVQAGGATFLP